MDGYQLIDLDRVFPSFTNPRKVFDPAKLQELADSVKAHGVLVPILLRPAPDFRLVPGRQSGKPGYLWESDKRNVLGGFAAKEADGEAVRPLELVAGERRYRAAKLAGLEQIPAIVRDLSDAEALVIQVTENDQREDVLPSERARGYRDLVKALGSVEAAAAKLGKSASTLRGFLLLEDCPDDLMAAVDSGKVGPTVAGLVCRLPRHDQRDLAARCVLAGCMDPADLSTRPAGAYFGEVLSYRETKELVARHFQRELKGAPFKPSDKKLLPGVPSCTDCPKRAGNARLTEPEAFEGTRDDVCLDPACYRDKCQAQERRDALKAQAAPPANGRTPLPTVGSVDKWIGALNDPGPGIQAAKDRRKTRRQDREAFAAVKDPKAKADAAFDERYDRLLLGELAVSAEGLFGSILPKQEPAINSVLRLVAAEWVEASEAMCVTDLVRERRGCGDGEDLADRLAEMDGDQLLGLIVELTTAQLMDTYGGREKVKALAKALEVSQKDVEKRARKEIADEAKPAANGKAGKATGESIDTLGVHEADLERAGVMGKLGMEMKKPAKVTPVQINGRPHVVTSIEHAPHGLYTAWTCLPLWDAREFSERHPKATMRSSCGGEPGSFYFGVGVLVQVPHEGQVRFFIGSKAEARRLVKLPTPKPAAGPSTNGHAKKPKAKRQPAGV